MQRHVPVDPAKIRVERLAEWKNGAVVADSLIELIIIDLHGNDIVRAKYHVGGDVQAKGRDTAFGQADPLAVDIKIGHPPDALELQDDFPSGIGRINREMFPIPRRAVIGPVRQQRILRLVIGEKNPFPKLVAVPGVWQADGLPRRIAEHRIAGARDVLLDEEPVVIEVEIHPVVRRRRVGGLGENGGQTANEERQGQKGQQKLNSLAARGSQGLWVMIHMMSDKV